MSTIFGLQTNAVDGGEPNSWMILHTLLENRWLVCLITMISLGLGGLYTTFLIPQYRSEVLLQVENNHQGMGSGGGLAQLSLSNGFSGGNSVATQMALIQSPFILEPVINELGLNIKTWPKTNFFKNIFFTTKNSIQIKQFDVPQEKINRRFTIVVDVANHIQLYDHDHHLVLQGNIGRLLWDKEHTINLRVEHVSGAVGSGFFVMKSSNAAVIRKLVPHLRILEVGTKQPLQSTGVLSVSLIGNNPIQVTRILNVIARQTQLKDAKRKAQEASQTLDFLYHQLPLTKNALEQAENALNQYRSRTGKIDIKLQTQFLLNQLAELDKKLSLLNLKRIQNLQNYTPQHPIMHILDLEINTLKKDRSELEQSLKKIPASDQMTVNLMRDVGVKKTLYLVLLSKIQEFEVMKAGTISGVHILSFARLPDTPLSMHRVAICGGSILFGLMISLFVIIGRRILRPSVDEPRWCERQFNLACLAIIPYCKEQAESSVLYAKQGLNQLPILAQVNPKNLSIESLRSLRTSLQVTLTCASNNIVSVMGCTPGVGKSFVSINLAYLLASAGKRVLLIDADLRKGTLHKYLNEDPAHGLADVLSKKCSIEKVVRHVPIHENLDFISRGTYPKDPSELLMSHDFKEMIHLLSQQYDIVLLDTAPVLLVTDAVLIGAYSATNYLVLGAGVHQPQEIEFCIKRLSHAGVMIHGTVFNFHKANKLSGESYGQYQRYGGKYNAYYDDAINVMK